MYKNLLNEEITRIKSMMGKIMTEEFTMVEEVPVDPENNSEEIDESFWDDVFGRPSTKDATHTSLRGVGHSHIANDEKEKHHIIFNGHKFYDDDIEYAEYQDMGKLPRIEGGKLIIANPSWSL